MNDLSERRGVRHMALRAGVRLALRAFAVGALGVAGLPLLSATPVAASSVTSAAFTGGTGTVSVSGTLYAKQGGALTLSVVTSSDTKCVEVTGATTLPRQTSTTAKSSWTFILTAPAGDGAQAFTVAASPNFNANNCTGQSNSTQVSYTLDNSGPVVSAALSPAANAAGWNKANIAITWSASDTGSGLASGPTPASDAQLANTSGVTKTATATDRLGNSATGAVTVKLDKDPPAIDAQQTVNANGTTTVTFTCSDPISGITSCLADGTSPASSSKTVAGGVTVTGTATDVAGNTATASSTAPIIDAIPPSITHVVAPAANAAGWNNANVTVTFSCQDNPGGTGVKSCVVDGTSSPSRTVNGETSGTLVAATATDNANNVATDAVVVKLDKSEPSITASRTPAPNASGWNNTDVTVTFNCSDARSGVKTCPASVIKSGEGLGQSASGVAVDNADNTSGTASLNGINVDKTAPVLTSTFSSGWHTGDVTVDWSCTDALSGVVAQPPDQTVTGEGNNLSSTASCTDRAGNTASRTVTGIQIDRHAPTTGISGTSNDWTNGDVTVTLIASDNLSGVASTRYTIDDGGVQTGTTFTLSTEGQHTVTFFSTDTAGNVEATQSTTIKIDKTAPTISHAFSPLTYTDGAWINQDVTVTFVCADAGGSGLAGCTPAVTRTNEGASQQVVGTATDGAGNTASDTAVVHIDKTPPTVIASADRRPNAAGWYDDDVTVSFDASDGLSGIAVAPGPKVLGEGLDQSASGTATDAAGNSASAGVTGINIDKTPPVLTGTFASGWHTGDVTVDWSCTDALSGPAAQPDDEVVTGEGDNLSSTASCVDNAGNSTMETVTGIQIDRHAPTTVASVSGDVANDWYRQGGAVVTLSATDSLSLVDKTYVTVDGGSATVYAGPLSIDTDGTHVMTFWSVDNAGNLESATSNTLTLHIDTTPPSLSGAPTSSPNGNGWYVNDVTVHWTCGDATSGLDGDCPSDSVVSGEGDNLGASASVSDNAGNVTNTMVGGIRIDRTPPNTVGSVGEEPLPSGWYSNAVEITLAGSDGISGVDVTFYSVDGGAPHAYGGPFSFGNEGSHEIAFWSTDKAGNVEVAGAPLTLKIDTTAPTTKVINPISPDTGWFVTSGIPVAFTASDDDSGIAATYYTIDGGPTRTYGDPFTANLSTGVHTITYWSVDVAANEEAHATTNTIAVNVDTDAPTIAGAATPPPNGFGWNNGDVHVTFTCADIGSGLQTGVAGCAGDTVLANDGAGQSVHGDAIDVAGNRSSTDVKGINIDTTKPTLSGAPTTDANADGWYKGDVTIAWTGVDGLSGIDPGTQPANSLITGEGRTLGAGPVHIADKAGNVSDDVTVTGFEIDRSAPVVTGVLPAGANGAGWYHGDVVVGFTCADPALADGSAGSGVASCPSDVMLKGDGANQSVTSAAATDVAGNASAGKTVSGIYIDGHEPQTTADNQCLATNGYCKGTTATVVLTSTDVGPSGVKEIHYAVNGGAEQVAAGATTTLSIPIDGTGNATFTYYAVDNAGNVEPANKGTLDYDNIAPTVTHTVAPAANSADWNNSNVTVHFNAKDTDPGSGVVGSSVTADVTISAETSTSGTVVNGSAADTAGNVGTDSVTIRLDKTVPNVAGTIVPGTTMVNGWYTGSVRVHFSCSDTLSGVAVCPDEVSMTSNGANQSVSRSASDVAGNAASATVSGIAIDNENPTVTFVNVANRSYTVGAVPAPTCIANDSFSGVATCKVTVTGGNANGVGTFTYAAVATDKAGNTSVVLRGTFAVGYRFDGFLQPINDTAHQVGTSTSVFKAGSTVPVKFQLKNAADQIVQAVAAPVWLAPVKGSSMSAPVDESVYNASADGGATYRFDAAAQQYIYNWKTGNGGNYWRIGVTFDDGQTYYVNIGLR
jgi:hypothetical protein